MDLDKICNEVLDELDESYDIEPSLRNSFIQVIKYLNQFPETLSVRSKKNKPDITKKEGITFLAVSYVMGFYTPTIPKLPTTVPDKMVNFVMQKVFTYSESEAKEIEKTHLESMASENTVGTLLERYLDSVLRPKGWAWCCGNFVKAIDFIKYDNGKWFELQIKNRSNTENSSSKKIREGTTIHKWYRSKAKTGATMWDNLPDPMKGLNLSEEGFKTFVENYLEENINLGKTPKPKLKI